MKPPLGGRLRAFVERGAIEPCGFILSNEAKELIEIPYVVVRIVPLHLSVRFACECAEYVIPLFEQAHPDEREPRELVKLVEAWTEKKATKKAVREKLAKVQEIANRIDREWHKAYAEGAFNSLSKPELDLTNRPLFAIDVVLATAASVVAPPRTALSNVDEAMNKCIEAETVGSSKGDPRAKVDWMVKRLLALVNDAK
jgi:hypothetical protein